MAPIHTDEIKIRKAKIRQRYRGINPADLTLIPAAPTEDIYTGTTFKRVAVYARVSTDDPNQTSSYELQKNYYEDLVKKHENWSLVNIYADEGISGTSLNHRDAFVRMIKDCEHGKIDLVITKSVSRFARNVEDCIHYSRELKALRPSVGILFETEGIYTLSENSEMQLSFIATLAQEESHTKSEGMNRSIEMRFERGIFLTPVLLGYDHDEDGNLIINEEEAQTVKLIFMMYLAGENCNTIAEELTRLGRITKKGNTDWAPGSVYGILKNERYCGDVLARKTYTPNYLNHKSVKNNRNRPQYYQEDHHDPIVSREDYIAVQHIMDGAKYGYTRALPELKVIDRGVLRGFVQINPKWHGFKVKDYLEACHSVLTDEDYLNPFVRVTHKRGDFDFRKYQVTREQFMPDHRRISVSVSMTHMKFSLDAATALEGERYIEILYHPLYQMIAVRRSSKKNSHSVRWATWEDEKLRACKFKGSAFLPILYELCHWQEKYRYIVEGYVKEDDEDKVLIFYMDEAEYGLMRENKRVTAYPTKWKDSFGDEYNFQRAKSISIFKEDKEWNLSSPGVLANTPVFRVREQSELRREYMNLIHEMEERKNRESFGVKNN